MQVYIIFDLLNYAKQYRKPPKKDGRAYQVYEKEIGFLFMY